MPPNRKTRRALKYPQGINPTDESPPFVARLPLPAKNNPPDTKPPFVARLPLIQPALVHFFSHQMSSNHWCHLIRTELDRKERDNEHTLLQAKIYNELIKELTRYAQHVLRLHHVHRDTLRHKMNINIIPEFKQKSAITPFLVLFLAAATFVLIDFVVKNVMLDKSWLMVPGENSSQTLEPNSFLISLMRLLFFVRFNYELLSIDRDELANDVDLIEIRPSLEKLELGYQRLRLYPSESLENYRKTYYRHIRGRFPMSEIALHDLLKKVQALKKTETPDNIAQAKEQPTPPEAAPNERSPRRRPA